MLSTVTPLSKQSRALSKALKTHWVMQSRQTLSYAGARVFKVTKAAAWKRGGCFAGHALGAPVQGWTWHFVSGQSGLLGAWKIDR